MPSGVSVVIPSYRGAVGVVGTLASLAGQTLTRDRFEVVLIVNGPAAANRKRVVGAVRPQFPDLDMRIITTPIANASLAWNLGVQAARMEWLTFLDDDDTVTPTYLEAMLDAAAPGVVPLGQIHDRHPDGTIDIASHLNKLIAAAAGTTPTARELPQALGFNAAKFLPTRWARGALYDLGMTSGQDVAYWGEIAMAHDLVFAVIAPEHQAAYVRDLSERSMSRQEQSFEFSVAQRLDVIQSLSRSRRRASVRRRSIANHLIAAQVHLINRYLVGNPQRRRDVVDAISRRELTGFPFASLNRDLATIVAVTDDGEHPRRKTVDEISKLLHRDEPVDIVAVARTSPARSWLADFWIMTSSPHLEGRVIHVELPTDIETLAGTPLGSRDVVCVSRSRAARQLAAGLRDHAAAT